MIGGGVARLQIKVSERNCDELLSIVRELVAESSPALQLRRGFAERGLTEVTAGRAD